MTTPKIPSNGTLLVQPDGSVQLAGRIGGDVNQVVTYNAVTSALESTSLSRIGVGGGKCIVTVSRTPPPNPSNGELWWNSQDGRLYIYYTDPETSQWVDASPGGGSGGGTVTISPTPPTSPSRGDLWWNSTDGRLYIWYVDPETSQWVDTSPGGGSGTTTVISDTPPSNPTEGDLWWNDQDGRLYIYYIDTNTAQWVDTNPNGGSGPGGASVVSISSNPPSNPTQGQLWWNDDDGRLYVFYDDGNTTQWVDTSPNGGSSTGSNLVTVSDTPPGNPTEGQLWWNSDDGRLFVYYDDGNTAQWVDTSPSGGGGGGGVTTTTTISTTPPSPASEGDLWWNSDDGRFYIFYDDGTTAQWVDTSPAGGVDLAALQQTIIDLEARVAALENP